MSKVLLLQELISRLGMDLRGKSIFDYGFGAGTFFRHCDSSARVFGVELDDVTVQEVSAALRERGFRQVDLDVIRIEDWSQHRLLQRRYDVIICSHVLEHLEDPASFLDRLGTCLEPEGCLLALVPINERKQDPHHVRRVDRAMVRDWLANTPFELVDWVEEDSWLYWIQPLFTHNSGIAHSLAQAVSLGLGTASIAVGHRRWFQLSAIFARISRSLPTQAAFAVRRKTRNQERAN